MRGGGRTTLKVDRALIELIRNWRRFMLKVVPKRLSKGSAHWNGGAYCGGAYWNRSVYLQNNT